MIKLSEVEWSVDEVKKQSFDYFKENIELLVSVGNLFKPSDSEVKRVYERLTGLTIKKNKE